MDFSEFIESLTPKLNRLINIINDESVSPELRKAAHRSALEIIGSQIYAKAYDMTAWDLDIADTLAPAYDRAQASGMARNLSDSLATGDMKTAKEQSTTFMLIAVGMAQSMAFQTAGSFGKHRILRRRTTGKEDCSWCDEKRGTYFNPKDDDFRRHGGCDCIFTVEGFHSRNGTLNNYTKRR